LDLKLSVKPYLPTVVVSIILFITVFLPWVTASALGVTISSNGTKDWGPLVLVMSIIGVGLAFVGAPKIRSLGTIFAGILAIAGFAIYWARLGGLTVGYGLIIALIASLGLIAVGYLEYRTLGQPDKPAAPPPAPPTPPQQ
jgi:hypothetical protein